MDEFCSETLAENLERAYTALQWAKVMASALGQSFESLDKAIESTYEAKNICAKLFRGGSLEVANPEILPD